VSVHAGQGALQSEDQHIACPLVGIVPTCALGIELRNSKTIIFPFLLSCRITLGARLSKIPRELTLPNNSATWVETVF